ncbi:MAG: hypothetical protein JSS02_18340 [Planctomycetes bacterium]|nr:hypothetical protein [Planctomycetota bacterium]
MLDKPNQPTDLEIVNQLQAALGQPSLVAERLGCSLSYIYRRARRSARVREALRLQRGKLIDTAVVSLWQAVSQGESWAVKYALDLWGRARDFTDGGEDWHQAGSHGPLPPHQVRQLILELMKHASYTESVRTGGAESDAGHICPESQPGAVEDGRAPGGN